MWFLLTWLAFTIPQLVSALWTMTCFPGTAYRHQGKQYRLCFQKLGSCILLVWWFPKGLAQKLTFTLPPSGLEWLSGWHLMEAFTDICYLLLPGARNKGWGRQTQKPQYEEENSWENESCDGLLSTLGNLVPVQYAWAWPDACSKKMWKDPRLIPLADIYTPQ